VAAVNVEYGDQIVAINVGENTQAAVDAAATATTQAGIATTQAGIATDAVADVADLVASVTLPGLLATASSLPFLGALSDTQDLIIADGLVGYRTNLRALKKYLGLIPTLFVTGTRLAIMGDSRSAAGTVSQPNAGTPFTTGVNEATKLQGVHLWMMQALDWPMEVVGDWTFGGSKTSECCHTHALEVVAARLRPGDAVMMLVSTNDPVDYTSTGGLGPIPFGDPTAPPASQPRVGDRAPVGAGIGQQGTTIGNFDKAFRFCESRGIRVIVFEIPTQSASRTQRNAEVHQWFMAQKALVTYPNVIFPNAYTSLLADPASDDDPATATGVWRTDLNSTLGLLYNDDTFPLHPSPAGAKFIGETIAADTEIVSAFAGRDTLVILPDGTNDAAFINPNPSLAVGDGSGVLGYSGSASPAPTGTLAQGWEIGHDVSTGTFSVVASFDGDGEQIITITRTGGSDAGLVRAVELRQTAIPITPVAGDVYLINGEAVAPARNPEDLFTVFSQLVFSETGLVDDYGQSISAGSYGSYFPSNPNFFPKVGATLITAGVPFEITPAIVASTTGTIDMSARIRIAFPDTLDTGTNGPLVIKIKSTGLIKRAGVYTHVTTPAVPAPGAACTATPAISGSLFVGGTITLTDGTFASGTIASRRLLRDGVPVSYTGTSYDLTSADLGKRFVFENTSSTGTIAQSQAFGPIAEPSAELAALIAALAGEENNAIFDFTDAAIVAGIYRVEDYSGNNNPALQSAGVRQPGISSTLGAVLDGSNDCAGFTWQTAAPSTVSVVMAMTKTAGDTNKRLLSDGTTSNAAGLYQTSITALVGTWTVDGVSVTTQTQLFNALEVAGEHILMVTGLNVSAWPALFFGRTSNTPLGSFRRGVVIDEATASLAAARAAAVDWVEAT